MGRPKSRSHCLGAPGLGHTTHQGYSGWRVAPRDIGKGVTLECSMQVSTQLLQMAGPGIVWTRVGEASAASEEPEGQG